MSTYMVHLGEKCDQCHCNLWRSLQGFLRCACGRLCWIERQTEGGDTRFRFTQGPKLPAGYLGWSKITR